MQLNSHWHEPTHTHNQEKRCSKYILFLFEVRPSKISCGTLQTLLPQLQPLQPLQMDVSSPGDIQILAARVTRRQRKEKGWKHSNRMKLDVFFWLNHRLNWVTVISKNKSTDSSWMLMLSFSKDASRKTSNLETAFVGDGAIVWNWKNPMTIVIIWWLVRGLDWNSRDFKPRNQTTNSPLAEQTPFFLFGWRKCYHRFTLNDVHSDKKGLLLSE